MQHLYHRDRLGMCTVCWPATLIQPFIVVDQSIVHSVLTTNTQNFCTVLASTLETAHTVLILITPFCIEASYAKETPHLHSSLVRCCSPIMYSPITIGVSLASRLLPPLFVRSTDALFLLLLFHYSRLRHVLLTALRTRCRLCCRVMMFGCVLLPRCPRCASLLHLRHMRQLCVLTTTIVQHLLSSVIRRSQSGHAHGDDLEAKVDSCDGRIKHVSCVCDAAVDQR